ncbi:hypothetical protein F4810DRAFT_96023 [Camillea tinctor]|nr:hypothetical protein F4810DRAFT_96023 [Camillea tinctor]
MDSLQKGTGKKTTVFIDVFTIWFEKMVRRHSKVSETRKILPEILYEFALRLGNEKNIRFNQKMMNVAQSSEACKTINRLLQQTDNSYDPENLIDDDIDSGAIYQLLKESEAARWLASTLEKETSLVGYSPIIKSIRQATLEYLRKYQSTKDHSLTSEALDRTGKYPKPPSYHFKFHMDWGLPKSKLFSNSMTVTKKNGSCQTMECDQYAKQMWPAASLNVFPLINTLIKYPTLDYTRFYEQRSGSWMLAAIDGNVLTLEACGIEDEITEIAEQLTFIGLTHCQTDQPEHKLERIQAQLKKTNPQSQKYSPELSYFIKFSQHPIDNNSDDLMNEDSGF